MPPPAVTVDLDQPAPKNCSHCGKQLRPNGVGWTARKTSVLRTKNGRKYWEKDIRVDTYMVDNDIPGLELIHADCIENVIQELRETL